jgi:uncharacterized protein (TIGR03435 family)
MAAYSILPDRIVGPAWLQTERYDIIAAVPPETTREQFNEMLRNLLAARFHMTLHHELKAVQGYELTVGKDGSKLKEAAVRDPSASPASAAAGASPVDSNGFPKAERPGLFVALSADRDGADTAINSASHLTAIAQPLTVLLRVLGAELDGPVADRTGLTGVYDFKLEYVSGGSGSKAVSAEPAADIASAVETQLGLKLERKKLLLDNLVIEHADKIPVKN